MIILIDNNSWLLLERGQQISTDQGVLEYETAVKDRLILATFRLILEQHRHNFRITSFRRYTMTYSLTK
jgi:hypothetical protein